MNNFIVRAKSISIKALVVVNIAAVGAIGGAYAMHNYDEGTSNKTAQVVQKAITAASSAQAASPKVNGQ